MINTLGLTNPRSAVKFSSSLLLDLGGSGARLDLTTNNGKSFTIPVKEDVFMGAVNVRFRDIEKPELKRLLSTLVDKFISKRLTDDKAKNRAFEVGLNGENMTLEKALEADPLDKIVCSSAGQIKYDNANRPFITAIDNLPAYVKEVDIMAELANTVVEKFNAQNLGHLINADKLKSKGIIINDALASVMGLAKKLEKETGTSLTAETPPVVLMDVGSGIATGGIDGNILYTAESQNVRTWYKSSIERLDMLNKRPITQKILPESFEEVAAMRGITYQTIDILKSTPMAKRTTHPIYQQIKAAELTKLSKPSNNDHPTTPHAKDSFDEAFEKTPVGILKDTAWKEGWVNQEAVFELHLKNPTDRLGQIVANRFYDGLAALAATKIMEHKAQKAYLQCINFENALNRVNAERVKSGGVALKNPLVDEVNQRVWQFMDYRARTFCAKNAVELVTVRNNDGAGYLPYVFRPEMKTPWIIRGISEEKLRALN